MIVETRLAMAKTTLGHSCICFTEVELPASALVRGIKNSFKSKVLVEAKVKQQLQEIQEGWAGAARDSGGQGFGSSNK